MGGDSAIKGVRDRQEEPVALLDPAVVDKLKGGREARMPVLATSGPGCVWWGLDPFQNSTSSRFPGTLGLF